MEYLTLEQKQNLVNKFKSHFDAYISFGTADLGLDYPVILEFGYDRHCYTDHRKIHIGLDFFEASSDDELIISIDYVIGHEIQHIRSTPDKMWTWGQKRGIEVILEKASKILEKKPRRFHKDMDYELFFQWLIDNGYGLSHHQLHNIVHYIKNSLEDGRIERIRSIKRKGFKEKMTMFRAKMWEAEEVEGKPISEMDDSDKLSIILNQVLSLGTMSIYQKGFKEHYAGTELEDRCKKLIPFISKAVTGKSCEDCMKNAICIMEELTDLIISTAKMSEMEKILRDLIKQIINDENRSSYGNSGKTEESTSESGETPFGISDLNNKGSNGECSPTNSQAAPDAKTIDIEKAREAVKKAMKDALTKQQEDIDLIKDAAQEKKHASPPLSNQPGADIKPNPKAENIKKLYGDRIYFEEFKREYKCNIPLPFDLAGKSRVFSKKIDEVIQKQFKPAVRCKKSGKIDGGMVYKLGMNRTDIFMTPARSDKLSGCCYILGDNSGSMGSSSNSKRAYCWKAVAEIEEGYSKLMPLKICAFDSGSGVYHELIKDWNEKLPNSGAYNFMLQGRPGGRNMDGYSISVATDEILRQNGKIKMLIVLSDGAPDSYERTAEAIKYARDKGVVLVGIYFCDVGRQPTMEEKRRFEGMYGTDGYAIVTTPENISKELYNVMKKTFLS